MKRTNIDLDWSLKRGTLTSYEAVMHAPGEKVNLPHDMEISTDVAKDGLTAVGCYKGQMGTYTKYIQADAEWKDKEVYLDIDGAYRNAEVSFNGNLICFHPYGYGPFIADLTPYVKPGLSERISIMVNNLAPYDARWYTGTGLTRHIDLLVGPKVHLTPHSIFAYTERIEDRTAFVKVEVTVANKTAATVVEGVRVSLYKEGEKDVKASGYFQMSVPALGERAGFVRLVVDNPKLWDLDHPELYVVKAVTDTGDEDETLFGIRTITVDRKNGLKLNDKELKLKGGCVHCGCGILGGVESYDAWYYRLKAHKDAGYNAIRGAHNPYSKDFIEACDRLGMLIIDEAFDCWRVRDNNNSSDYHQFFEEWWAKDLKALMLRDRSHPCVFMWSIGNEIGERNGISEGYETVAKIAAYARTLDETRPINSSLPVIFNGLDDQGLTELLMSWMKNIQTGKKNASGMSNLESDYSDKQFGPLIEPYADQLDVCGYNYLDTRYEQDGKDYPNRIICGTESVPLDFARVWKNTMAFNYVIGDFVWTSQDYIGEAGIGQATYVTEEEAAKCNPIMGMPITYPWRTAASGNFDLCSHPTTALYLHQAAWGNKQTVIAVHNPANNGKVEKVSRYGWPECYHDWSFKGYEGQNVTVDVFSIGDQVELFVNKKSLGKKTAGEAVGFITKFDTVYQPGEIEAISYLKGQKLSSDLIKTVGEAVGLQFVSDKKELKADGQSLAFVDVYLVDNKGQPVVHQNLKATAVLEGEAGKLVAFGNGCPKTEENYTKGEFTSYRGYWQAVIRSENKLGSLTLKIKVDGLTDFSFQIEVK